MLVTDTNHLQVLNVAAVTESRVVCPVDEVESVAKYDHVSQSPGYWLSIASSILKSKGYLIYSACLPTESKLT